MDGWSDEFNMEKGGSLNQMTYLYYYKKRIIWMQTEAKESSNSYGNKVSNLSVYLPSSNVWGSEELDQSVKHPLPQTEHREGTRPC